MGSVIEKGGLCCLEFMYFVSHHDLESHKKQQDLVKL